MPLSSFSLPTPRSLDEKGGVEAASWDGQDFVVLRPEEEESLSSWRVHAMTFSGQVNPWETGCPLPFWLFLFSFPAVGFFLQGVMKMMDQDGANKTLLVPFYVTAPASTRPAISPDGTRIIFENGLGDSFHLYVVEDPDGNGIWEDTDGDHVADICDGYPDDPNRGYITDDDDDDSPGFGIKLVAVSVLIAVPVVWWRRKGGS